MSSGPDERGQELDRLKAFVQSDELGAKLLALLDDAADKDAAAEPATPIGTASDEEILAAISDTFILEELGPHAPEFGDTARGPANREAEDALLSLASPVIVGGRRRLRLSPPARGDIIRKARSEARFATILAEALNIDRRDFDAISLDAVRRPTAWLRCFLSGDYGDLHQAPADELAAAVTALEDLEFVDLPDSVPNVLEARRLLELAQLLEPLRILVGATGGWDGGPARDRFVGRDRELKALRSFVDELAAANVLESVERGLSKVAASAAGLVHGARPGLLRITAQGGLGKSTLMAKFVLDHAMGQVRPFPFVYLDFDRASLQPRDPRSLLAESVRQIRLQFPDRADVCNALLDGMALEQAGQGAPSFDPYAGFQALIQQVTHKGRRALLLVLDTMEVVQYDPHALQGVEAFLRGLGHADLPQLRVVAAGRAGMASLGRALGGDKAISGPLPLKSFSVDDAARMANTLGRSLMGASWNPAWAKLIVGSETSAPERREPLSIRVAVELLRDPSVTDREALAAEIGELGEGAHESFVARLYQRRVLEHVQDEDVRRLAWPGLVVRRVTVEIVRDVLAARCGVDPGRAQDVFDKLAREVWIVDREGDALVHRRDLRARTLPLMRRYRPPPNAERASFDEINAAAVDYFAALAPSSAAHRAEWIYHRLLGGEDAVSVDADWTAEMSDLLSRAVEDFGRDSTAGRYLAARTARRLMAPSRISDLAPWLALEHLARTAPELGGAGDLSEAPVVRDLSARIAVAGMLPPLAERTRQILLVRTGRWAQVTPALLLTDASDERALHAWAFLQAREAFGTGLAGDAWEMHRAQGLGGGPPSVRILAQRLALARLSDSPEAEDLDDELANLLARGTSGAEFGDLSNLRTAAVFGRSAVVPATRAWLQAVQLRSPAEMSFSLSEVRALGSAFDQVGKLVETLVLPLLDSLGGRFGKLDRASRPLRIGHSFVAAALMKVLQTTVAMGGPDEVAALRRFFAARDEDWVVPMGYAAGRTLPGAAPAVLMERIVGYGALDGGTERREARQFAAEMANDPVGLLRRADEAADLAGAGALWGDLTANSLWRDDLNRLVSGHASWRSAIHRWLAVADVREGVVNSHRPPRPGPVRFEHDPQKGRWGGRAERDGRRLSWRRGAMTDQEICFDLVVEAIDGAPLQGPVVFHLHDTFPKPTIWIRRIRDGREARLEEVSAYGAFTVGAQVQDGRGQWLSLELDLSVQDDMPAPFRYR